MVLQSEVCPPFLAMELVVGTAQTRPFAPRNDAVGRCPHLRVQRCRHTADRGPADQPAHDVGCGHELGHIDAGRNSQAFEHVDHVLGCDIAGRAGGVGAAAETAGGGIDHAAALLHPGIEIGQRLAVGVVEMHREIGHRHVAGDRAQEFPGLQGRADADGVAERDFVAAEVPQHFCNVDHRLRLDLALIGTSEHAGNIAAHPDAVGFGAGEHRLEALDRFRNRAVDVGAGKALRGGGEYRDQFRARGLRSLVALLVRHQHREFASRMMADATQHLGRAHHLRDRLR